MDDPIFKPGDHVTSAWHQVTGTVQRVEWSTTFGQPTYLIIRDHTGGKIYVCQSDLKLD